MSDQTAIVPTGMNALIKSIDDAERVAKSMAESGFFQDAKQASQAMVKIMAGQELGFGSFASMTGINIIQGKPTLGSNLIAAAIKKSGHYNYRVTVLTDTECLIKFYEGKEEIGQSRFTVQDAEKAGLLQKDIWKKYPKNMLFARAISNGQRWYCPDVFGGATVYTPEELGANVNEEGDFINAKFVDAPAEKQPPQPPAQDNAPKYQDGTTVLAGSTKAFEAYVAAHEGKTPDNFFNLKAWAEKVKKEQQPQPPQSEGTPF